MGEDGGRGEREAAVLGKGKFALKPLPDLMRAALLQGGSARENAVMVGDNMSDLVAAHRAGVEALVLVTSSVCGRDAAAAVGRGEVNSEWGGDVHELAAVLDKMLVSSSLAEALALPCFADTPP
mmetsp:Transcript_84130/g.123046  ORF Transcript_84130/g.123046 Transcript_84130/m.123046 type:complete len:124 (+) Transcript_84130:3-374(+)